MTRWQGTDAPRGDDYDARWRSLAAAGKNVHGEADLVDALLRDSGGTRVLDAGCGTGRVAIELARRGHTVMGVDADQGMLTVARAKAPELQWVAADLTDLAGHVDEKFDLVVLAGNVMIYLTPGTEAQVLSELGSRLVPEGLLVAGFQIRTGRLALAQYDDHAASAGFEPLSRWATWQREPFHGGEYAVSVHRLARLAP
jgi:SAM-dependent methyltransferase